MVAVAVGTAVAGVAGAGASIISGNKAASTAQKTAAASNSLQTDIYNQNKVALAPFEAGGSSAADQLRRTLGLGDSNTGVSVNGNPALSANDQYEGVTNWLTNQGPYATGLAEGQKSVTAALGAKGELDSGAAQKALLNYGQTYFKSNYDDYVGQLTALSGQGLSAASAQAGVGQNYANSVSAINNTAASAAESADLNTGKQINSALGTALSAFTLNQGLSSSYGGATKAALTNSFGSI